MNYEYKGTVHLKHLNVFTTWYYHDRSTQRFIRWKIYSAEKSSWLAFSPNRINMKILLLFYFTKSGPLVQLLHKIYFDMSKLGLTHRDELNLVDLYRAWNIEEPPFLLATFCWQPFLEIPSWQTQNKVFTSGTNMSAL